MDTGYAQKKRCQPETVESVRREEKEQVGFEPGVKKRRSDGWWEWRVDGGKWGGRCRKRWVIVRVVGAKLSESSWKLILELRWSILKGTVCDLQGGWRGWMGESDQCWRTGATGRLNGDEIMQIRRLGGCKNFVGKWLQFVFNAFSYFEPAKRGSDVTGFGSFGNSTSDTILDLLDAGYLRLW